jgi:STAS-like domain of unknown function (DUF4325)
MVEPIMLNVATDFSRYPSGRYPGDSRFSGERFRSEFLLGPLKKDQVIEINLDGTLGYGSSFLDEAFGGLVRICGFSASFLRKHLKLKSKDANLVDEAWSYIG